MSLKFTLFILGLALAVCVDPSTYTYKTVGNVSIELDVYVPARTPYTKYPVMFQIHGGGYFFGAKSDGSTKEELQDSLDRGFVVVSIDYRLLPGVVLEQIIKDMQDAYQWVRTQLVQIVNIDPDNIVVFGQSAGGGLTVIAGYMLNPRPKALYAFYPGCTNFMAGFIYDPLQPLNQTLVKLAEELYTPIYTEYPQVSGDPRNTLYKEGRAARMAGWFLTSQDPNVTALKIEAMLSNYSAILHVDADYPPTYLNHGLNDTNVPYNQSVQMAAALELKNIPYQLVLVPDEGHSWDEHASAEQYQQYIEPGFDFVESYITTPKKMESFLELIDI